MQASLVALAGQVEQMAAAMHAPPEPARQLAKVLVALGAAAVAVWTLASALLVALVLSR